MPVLWAVPWSDPHGQEIDVWPTAVLRPASSHVSNLEAGVLRPADNHLSELGSSLRWAWETMSQNYLLSYFWIFFTSCQIFILLIKNSSYHLPPSFCKNYLTKYEEHDLRKKEQNFNWIYLLLYGPYFFSFLPQYFWILASKKKIRNVYCFQPLSFGVIC